MSCVRSLPARGALAAASATAVLLFLPALVRAEEGEPTIEEMWETVEAHLGAPGGPNRPAEKDARASA